MTINRLYIVTLLAMFALAMGCGGGAVENPEVFDEQTLQEVEQHDVAVENAERQQ